MMTKSDTQNKTKKGRIKWIPSILGIMLLLLIWHLACSFGKINAYVLPSPEKVAKTFIKILKNGEIARDIGISLLRVMKGFGIAFILAFVLAAFRVFLPALEPWYSFSVQFFRNVPPISMIPLLIIWCGIGETTKTVIIVLASFFPMYLSIVKGFTGADPKLLEVGKAFSYGKGRLFLRVILPCAIPDILIGMRTSLGYAWRAIIGAEMVAASTGLGHMILFAQQMSRTDKVIIGICVIGLIGLVTDFILGTVIRLITMQTSGNGWE